MSAALDSDSIKFLEDVKKGKPRRFILLVRGASIQRLLIFKKGSAESLLQRVKKEGFKGQSYIGVVDGKGQDISFKLCAADGYDDAPGKEVLLKAFLSSESGMTFKPKYEIVPELPQVDEGDDDTATATDVSSADRPADPVAELREKMRAAVQKLTPSIKEFVAANPQRRQEVLGPLAIASDFVKGDAAVDVSAAVKALKDIQTLLIEAAKTQAAAQSSQSAGERGRKISDDGGKAVLDGKFMEKWKPARAAWQSASDDVDAQIAQLQNAMRGSGFEEIREVAEYGLNGATGDFKVPLIVAMRNIDSATDDARQAEIVKAQRVIADFKQHIVSSELVDVIDDNPFEVTVTIRQTLGAALTALENALA